MKAHTSNQTTTTLRGPYFAWPMGHVSWATFTLFGQILKIYHVSKVLELYTSTTTIIGGQTGKNLFVN
jgi:hypothetical protein